MLLRINTHLLALRPCPSAMLSYRAVITLGSERGNVTLLQLQRYRDQTPLKALTTARPYRAAPSVT